MNEEEQNNDYKTLIKKLKKKKLFRLTPVVHYFPLVTVIFIIHRLYFKKKFREIIKYLINIREGIFR